MLTDSIERKASAEVDWNLQRSSQDMMEPKVEYHIFFTYISSILILSKFYLPTDAQLNCLKINFKIHSKIYIKTDPTCFGVITIIRERTIRSC